MADSNQQVVQNATAALKSIIANSDIADWLGYEWLQHPEHTLQDAIDIVTAIEAGNYTLDGLFLAAQSKTSGTYADGIPGEPNPVLTVLGHVFEIGQYLGETKVESWTSGNAKNLQYHFREYFTSVDNNAAPGGYHDGWEILQATNQVPQAKAVAANANEDGPAITVTPDFTDDDANDTHTFTVDTTSTVGSVKVNDDGTFSYDAGGKFEYLADGETAEDTFTYTVNDGHGGSSTETVTITITGQNDNPEAKAVAANANEDGPAITVTPDFTDDDANDTHTFTVDTTLTVGSVKVNDDGTFSYDAGGKFEYLADGETAEDTFTYTVNDGHGGSSTETVTITITGQNDNPEAKAVAANANEDGPAITVTPDFTDDDANDTHTFTVDTTLTVGSVKVSDDGTFSYDADGKFEYLADGETAEDTFTYTVNDGHGGSSTETVTVTITGQNDKPEAEAWNVSAVETDSEIHDKSFVDTKIIDLLDPAHVSDVDGDDLSVSNVQVKGKEMLPSYIKFDAQTGKITVDLNDYELSYGLHNGDHQVDEITYTVSDGHGGAIINTVFLDVTGTADKYTGVADVDAFTKTANGQMYNFDISVPEMADEDAFNFSGIVTFSATGDIDGRNEHATISIGGELVDANDSGTGLMDLSGPLQNGDDAEPGNYTVSGKTGVIAGGFDDGHVQFSASFSGQVGIGTTMDASLAYDFWM